MKFTDDEPDAQKGGAGVDRSQGAARAISVSCITSPATQPRGQLLVSLSSIRGCRGKIWTGSRTSPRVGYSFLIHDLKLRVIIKCH